MKKDYLKEFKKLEKKLRGVSGVTSDNAHFDEIIKKAKQNNPIVEFKEGIIRDLYALRNVFAHKDRERYIAEVNELAFDSLGEIIKLLENPPKVGKVFEKEVYSVTTEEITEVVLRNMKENLYTHVPVYENEGFVGVFSETTIFDWLIDNIERGRADFYKQTLEQVNRKYLNSPNNLYKFVSAELDIFSARKIFEDTIWDGKRMGVIFITKGGKKDEKPTGIITAWDLPKIKEFLK
jgi:CBS domain-containing protein